jgi:K+-sensing histidine kinase KdpD
MRKPAESIAVPFEKLEKYILALFLVAASTAVMFMIGRDTLGEGVIALLYLAPISWVAARWGQGPGILAAVTSALAFDFLFIPPFFTFTVGSLEGWLLLGIFLVVAIIVVGRIQVGLKEAQRREHEALLMVELSNDLAAARTRESIAQALGTKVQEYYQAELVQVVIQGGAGPLIARIPAQTTNERKADLIVPILAAKDLVGEVRIWQGAVDLPLEQDRLLRNLTNQSALALERAQLLNAENVPS